MAILYIEEDVLDKIDTAKIIDELAKKEIRKASNLLAPWASNYLSPPLPITIEHHQANLQRCRVHSVWKLTSWSKIIFSDKSRLEMSPNDRRRRLWRSPEVSREILNRTYNRQLGVMVSPTISGSLPSNSPVRTCIASDPT
ncbi:hypothetical protein TNCV_1453571 [Trichonephila clavipes]|nr:hypothetical protein TNCV_1453571 [Trichonephila clavipes]